MAGRSTPFRTPRRKKAVTTAAPVFPAPSVAVQLTLSTPSLATVSAPLAWAVFKPVSGPTVASVQVMAVTRATLLAV